MKVNQKQVTYLNSLTGSLPAIRWREQPCLCVIRHIVTKHQSFVVSHLDCPDKPKAICRAEQPVDCGIKRAC